MRPSDRQLVVCDLDQAGLYVGPRDVANWSFHAYRDRANPAPRTMLKTICRNVADTDERFLGVAWLASTVLYSAIWRYARGDRSLLRWHLLFLACFPDAVRNELTL